MSMINNSANPLESSKRFTERERELQQSRKGDTMSGVFRPAFGVEEDPTSVTERQAIEQPMVQQTTVQQPSWIDEQNSQLQQGQNALQEATNRALQAQSFRQQPSEYVEGTGAETGYKPDSNLSQSRQNILNTTASYAGTPYQLGGRTVKGIDCSGLVMSVYNQLGFNVQSHSVSGQARTIPGAKTSVSNLQPGDLVVWNDNSHIAVYAGNGMIWDASSSKGTTRRPLWSGKTYGIAVKLPGE